jgi:hypothetical protein
MKRSTLLPSLSILLCFALAGTAAAEESGPLERAGKAVDQTAKKVGKKLGQAGEAVGKGVKRAGEVVGEKVEQAGKKVQQAVKGSADSGKK